MHREKVEGRSAASTVRSSSRSRPSSADLSSAPVAAVLELQALEPRTLMAVNMNFEALVNASKYPGNQSETAIAINRANNNNIFAASNYGAFREPDQGPNDPISETGIFTTFSLDAGATWTPRVLGTGNDGFPVACCDPAAAFDEFGNLFFVYLASNPDTGQNSIVVLLSTDGGQTFAQSAQFFGDPNDPGNVDRCEVATARLPDGTVSVWVSYVDFGATVYSQVAVGAPVTGLGAVGPWTEQLIVPQGGPGSGAEFPHNVAHVAIGPNGQVAYAHQDTSRTENDKVYVNVDPDGLGPAPFGNAVFIDNTMITPFETLPGQAVRGLSVVATVAYDRSNGPHRGRLYVVYTRAVTEERRDEFGFPLTGTIDADVMLRFSDDNGATWSPAFRVNDDPVTEVNSQFFQRISVDPITGNVAVGWLDSRDDAGGGDTDDEIGYYLTVGQSQGNGIVFNPNMRLNVGLSNAQFSGNFGNDYGDYTGLDFYNGIVWANYPDNSNSTGDNPSGRLRAFDIYAARVRVTDATVPEPPLATPASPLAPTVQRPVSLVRRGRFYQLRMTYNHPSGINLGTVGNDDILVTATNEFSQPMQLVRARSQLGGTRVKATYRLAAPGGTWDTTDNAVYTATLQGGAVTATDGTASETGTITRFVVNVRAPRPRMVRPVIGPVTVAAPALPAPAAAVFSDASLLTGATGDDESARLLA